MDAAGQYYRRPAFGPSLSLSDCKRTVAIQSDQTVYGLTGSYAKVNIKPNGGKMQKNCENSTQTLCSSVSSIVFAIRAIRSPGKTFIHHKILGSMHSFVDFEVPDGEYSMETPTCFGRGGI